MLLLVFVISDCHNSTMLGKKASYGSFYEDEQFLDSSTSTHFTPFESDFVSMTLGNYS